MLKYGGYIIAIFVQGTVETKQMHLRDLTISCTLESGPLLDCVVKEFGPFELAPAAAKANSLRWPSANSPLKVRVMVEAELIASWKK